MVSAAVPVPVPILVFSFGRDHGYYGRILSQTVISTPTLAVADEGKEIVGFCFTPQDGNSLLSSVAGAIWLMDPEHANARIQVLKRFVFTEIEEERREDFLRR